MSAQRGGRRIVFQCWDEAPGEKHANLQIQDEFLLFLRGVHTSGNHGRFMPDVQFED